MTSFGLHHICLVRRGIKMFSTSTSSSYEDAINKLNSLQSNKATIEQIKKNLQIGEKCSNIGDMANYLQRIGIPLAKLDELSVIHVAGTKGKGSTSAMCESILRHHGFRTGFYSSPHLVAARERVRLDGQQLTKDAFATHLHRVYGLLKDTQEYDGDMPKYFAFLTVTAFYVFLLEKVDVAIIEVGIGGIVDFTNVLRKVPVVGITALGLDHTSILGTTLPEIAAAKAGVMKPGCHAYTVQQPAEAMDVLTAFADHVKCPLTVVPVYADYTFPKTEKPQLKVDLDAYRINASLAIQLSHAWMRITQTKNDFVSLSSKAQNDSTNGYQMDSSNGNKVHNSVTNVNEKCLTSKLHNGFKNGHKDQNGMTNGNIQAELVYEVPYETAEGLRQCKWPGRYHIVEGDYAKFYLDGAHTKESMEICANWYKDSSSTSDTLIFSATGDRNAEMLLQPLSSIPFQQVYFVIPTAHKVTTQNHDNYSLVEQEELVQRCRKHAEIWKKMNPESEVTVLECVADALMSIKSKREGIPSVLITGSLHLVGAALSILDPNLST